MPPATGLGYYLGRRFDPEHLRIPTDRMKLGSNFVLSPYDLLTHAIILGMTGSGKTILGKIIVEEAALQGIPAILIDPKGDLASMKLVFPTLSGDEFLPWIDTQKQQSQEKAAHELAKLYEQQFLRFNLSKNRLKEFKEKTNIVVLTPRSSTGVPVAISSLPNPPPNVTALLEIEPETVLDLIDTVVRSLIMRSYPMDPLGKHRTEEKFLNELIRYAWENGVPLHGVEGLATLIDLVERPPMKKIGIMSVDHYFPPKERHDLAVNLNNLLVGVEQLWHMGISLDIEVILETYSKEQKTPIIIFDLSEISSIEDKIFIVSRIAYSIYEWMRRKGGAGEPRLLFYIDEIGGGGGKTAFFPIHPYNPPSKPPLMLLIKQARAFGVCCLFSTQNPGDIDYKGLSNCGTWIVGKLSTKRDREKVLQGLGDIELFGTFIERRVLEKHIAMLETGEFVCKTRQGELEYFKERWLMSYHRTMTANDIRRITSTRDRKTVLEQPFQFLLKTKPRFLKLQYPASLEVIQTYFDRNLALHIDKTSCTYLPLLSFNVNIGFRTKHSDLKHDVMVDLHYGPFLIPSFKEKVDLTYVAETLAVTTVSSEHLLSNPEDDLLSQTAKKLLLQEVVTETSKCLQHRVRRDITITMEKQIQQEQAAIIEETNLTFQQALDELDYKVQTSNDRIADLRNQIQQFRSEVLALESDKASRTRAGLSTIMIMKSIASYRRKIRRCETNITREETKLKNYNHQKQRIRERQHRKITVINNQFQNVFTALSDRIDPQLLFDDLIEIFIPLCTADITLTNPDRQQTLTLEWNGFNGTRLTKYSCAECGTLIDHTARLMFCHFCLNCLCHAHVVRCTECGKTMCGDHAWHCHCGHTHCIDEPQFQCQNCKTLLCTHCRHLCDLCGNLCCPDHIATCVLCGKTVCPQHALTCFSCGTTICDSSDHYRQCAVCSTKICTSCIVECGGCGKPLCSEHATKCPNCGHLICEACIRVERTFLGFGKKQKCVHCVH